MVDNYETCFECYFYLFDKYKEEYDKSEVEEWKDSLIERFLTGDLQKEYSVFEIKGGGPLGSQWNSNAPLFCIATISENTGLEVLLNNTPIKLNSSVLLIEAHEKIKVVSFSLESKQWIEALIPISENDYSTIYDSSDIRDLQDIKNTPLGVGKILNISLKDSLTNIIMESKAFHIEFGE